MNSPRLLLAITTLALFVTLAVFPVKAGGMGNGAAQRMKLVVDSVDAAGGTIVIKSMVDNSVHTYRIDGKTRITLVNVKGSIDQLQAGQKVANLKAGVGEPPTLEILVVSPAAAAPAAPANK